jgi:hypothetical protein
MCENLSSIAEHVKIVKIVSDKPAGRMTVPVMISIMSYQCQEEEVQDPEILRELHDR